MLRNSYITVIISPGCTCMELTAGLKSNKPRELASNSTVMLRDRSTCVLALRLPAPDITRSLIANTLMPSASQMLRYIGTKA